MLARNSALNVLAAGLPLVLGLLLLPVLTERLGAERFGVLGLAWALLEYFTIFDVGLGRATTRRVADLLASDRSRISQTVAVSVATQLAFGIAGGALLAGAAPWLVHSALSVPPALRAEAGAAILVVAASLPVLLVALALRGVVEAAGRFDLATAVRIPAHSATFVIPAIAVVYGADLPTILLLLLAARVVTVAAFAWAARAAVRDLRWALPRDARELRPLLSFGGWLTVSNVANPAFLYLDRFALGAGVGLAAVGFYTPAFELAYRLLLLPGSIGSALLPQVTAAAARGDRRLVESLYAVALRYVLLGVVPAVAVVCALAPDILHAWLGPEYAEQGAPALRILALGVIVNGAAHVPSAYLHSLGRPDVNAKLHLAELALYVPLTFALVRAFGMAGAATAWSLRVSVDAAALFVAVRRIAGLSPAAALAGRRGLAAIASIAVLGAALVAAALVGGRTLAGVGLAAAGLALYSALAWRFALDASDRSGLLAALPFGGGRRSRARAERPAGPEPATLPPTELPSRPPRS